MDKLQVAEQFRKALQIYAQTLTNEQAMEIATIYPVYEIGRAYTADELLTYDINDVGDPQLYRVVQAHTSQIRLDTKRYPSIVCSNRIEPARLS